MMRGNAKQRVRESDESDEEAPSGVPRRVDDPDEDRDARLKEMQLADLGLDRASYITANDAKGNQRRVDVKALERTLRVNTPGTSEYKDAQRSREEINAWRRVYDVLKDDGTHDGKYDINDGQSHREVLQKTIKESDGFRHQQSHSRGGGRGGRTNSNGRGGGIVGTRGRGSAVASSSRSAPAPPPIKSSNSRSIRGNNNYGIRGRGAPLPRVVEETPSKRSNPLPVTATASANLQVPRQRQARAYNLGAEAGSRDAFRAAMNRHAISATTRSQTNQPTTQAHASSPGNQRVIPAISSRTTHTSIHAHAFPTENQGAIHTSSSTFTPPPTTTPHPSTAKPDTVFGDEIDFAPVGTRIPTPPPPSNVSLYSGSGSSTYLNDLQGLDLSPSLQEEPWGESLIDHKTKSSVKDPADEELTKSNLPKKNQGSVKPGSSAKIENSESRRSASSAQVNSSHGRPLVRMTAQALVAQLLALPSVQCSPEFAQHVVGLQSQLGRLGQTIASHTNARRISTTQNAAEVNAMGRHASPTTRPNQSDPTVYSQPATSNESARVPSSSGRINVYLHDQRAVVTIPRPGNTRSDSQTHHPTVNLPNRANAQSSAQEHGNLTSGLAQADSMKTARSARILSSSSAMTSYAGRLQELHNTLTESVDVELGNIAPFRGDLRDSEYSHPFFHEALTIDRRMHEQGPAIIGNHLLPAGRQRTRNSSLSSSVTNLSSQATIRPHEGSSSDNICSNQPFLSPIKRSNIHANTQPDTTGLSMQLEKLEFKGSRKTASAKEQSKSVHEKVALRQEPSSGKVYSIPHLLAIQPGPKDTTHHPTRSRHTQPPLNQRTTDVVPTAVEQPPVARRLNGVPLDEAPYPFATRSVEARPQTTGWLSLTSAQGQLATAAQVVTVATSTNAGTVSSAGISTATTIVPAATATGSRSTASTNAQVQETSNYPDNAITRQYAQAGKSLSISNVTQASAQHGLAAAQRPSTLSTQAAAFRVPQTSRFSASSTSNAFGGDMTTSRWSDTPAPTITQISARGQHASTAATSSPANVSGGTPRFSASSTSNALGGDMTTSRWSDTPAPAITQISARGQHISNAATSSPADVSGGTLAASRWSDTPAPTTPPTLAHGQQSPAATTIAPGRVFGSDMNASRWNDNAQSSIPRARAQAQNVSATATSGYGRDILGTRCSTANDVEITVVPTQPRARATAILNQAPGGGISASAWNPNVANRAAAIARDRAAAHPVGRQASPIRAPRETIDTSDPGIGDTTALFHKYNRPYRHSIPAFILDTASAAPETDPGAAVRRQYGMDPALLSDNTGRENQPMGRNSAKSLAGSDFSNSRQEQVRGRRS